MSISMSFTASSSGGKYKETLTIDQIPNHSHEQVVVADTHNNTGLRSDYNNDVQNGGSFPQGINTNTTGGGQSHNNIQPYIVCYIWRRTA
jgi:microcystin-dependent protein